MIRMKLARSLLFVCAEETAMDINVFPLHEVPMVLGTLYAIHPEPNDAQHRFLAFVARLHGVAIDCDLPLPTPEETATAITDPHRRKRLLQLAMVTTMIDGEIETRETQALSKLAKALEVDERSMRTMEQLAARRNLIARFDLARRLFGKLAGVAWREEGWRGLRKMLGAALLDGGEDPAVAERYEALQHLPEGSFGRAFWDHNKKRSFAFPGQRGGIPERAVFHDLGHVLAGYDTNPEGEMQQAAFQSGFVRDDGFAFLFFGIVQFHLGVRITPIAEPEVGFFDVEKVMTALTRGAACKIDLSDGWDFWPYMARPLDEVRAELGIPPLVTPLAA